MFELPDALRTRSRFSENESLNEADAEILERGHCLTCTSINSFPYALELILLRLQRAQKLG